MNSIAEPLARKQALTKSQRALRLISSLLQPGAWGHILKLLNYHNYAHVRQVSQMQLGPGACISPTAGFRHGEAIALGARAHIGPGCQLWAAPGGPIQAGDDLLLGPNVTMMTTNYAFDHGAPISDQPLREGRIRIGKDVWIGAGATVLSGADIGDGAVIAAGAVLRGNAPAYAIMAGVPARQVGSRKRP